MPKFTFICEDDPMPFSEGVVTKRTIEFEAVQIGDVVAEFELFLRGAGFNPNGVLDFVDESYYYGEPYTGDGHDGMGSTLEDYPEVKAELEKHSQYYFDTERNK
jgi:hypothetical protein